VEAVPAVAVLEVVGPAMAVAAPAVAEAAAAVAEAAAAVAEAAAAAAAAEAAATVAEADPVEVGGAVEAVVARVIAAAEVELPPVAMEDGARQVHPWAASTAGGLMAARKGERAFGGTVPSRIMHVKP
jgi:hypothetical protein